MSIRQDTNYRGRLVREVVIAQMDYTVTDDPDGITSWGPVDLIEPEVEVAGSEESPRFAPVWIMGWPKGYKGLPESTGPGDRVEIAGVGIFEILSQRRQLREHNDREGWTVLAELVEKLYPLVGTLYSQTGLDDDNDPGEAIILAMWDETDDQERSSRYDNMDGECPIEFAVEVNDRIVIDDRIWNVVTSRVNWSGPRRQLTLRSQVSG